MAPLDADIFYRRLNLLYDYFKSDEVLKSVDAICVVVGDDDNDMRAYCKSFSTQIWLLEMEIWRFVMLICEERVVFMSTKNTIAALSEVEKQNNGRFDLELELIPCPKDGVPTAQLLERTLSFAKKSRGGRRLGVFTKDKPGGSFGKAWRNAIDDFEMVNIAKSIGDLLACKDEHEVAKVRTAADYCALLFNKYLKVEVCNIIANEVKIKESKLSDKLTAQLTNAKFVKAADQDNMEVAFAPIFQSGEHCILKFSAESSDNLLQMSTIVCMFGLRYKGYCSSLIRTFIVFPTDERVETAEVLNKLYTYLLTELKHGTIMSHLYRDVISYLHNDLKRPDIETFLVNNFGFLSGTEFKDPNTVIGPNCEAVAKKGMVFQIMIGVANVTSKSTGGPYSLCLGDTVLINSGADSKPNTILTDKCKRSVKSWKVLLRNKEDDDDEPEVPRKSVETSISKTSKRRSKKSERSSQSWELSSQNDGSEAEDGGIGERIAKRKARASTKCRTNVNLANEKQRIKEQRELLKKTIENARRRLIAKQEDRVTESHVSPPPLHGPLFRSEVRQVSYRAESDFPYGRDEVIRSMIYTDDRNDTVIFPIFSSAYPIHVSTIKNVSQTTEADYMYLRINFSNAFAVATSSTQMAYLKELTYRSDMRPPTSSSETNLNSACHLIRTLQKTYREREAAKRELEGVVRQEAVRSNTARTGPRLRELYMRPSSIQKRVSGAIEACTNGLRYTPTKGQIVDIAYSNVKHAFYQSCDGVMIIALHFHLKSPVIIGKKKQMDIQFFATVGETTSDIGRARARGDRDEFEAEEAERMMREKMKQKFSDFIRHIEEEGAGSIKFETTFKDIGFYGAPGRGMCFLTPTSSCLVNLVEWPPFVVSLNEVELVHFERVDRSIRNFDMNFIPKDYTQKVVSISTIDSSQLDMLRKWLHSCSIPYTEGLQNLNWPKVMRVIVDDYEGFFASGGWEFLQLDEDGSKEEAVAEEEDELDDAYEPSGSDEEVESDEEDEEGGSDFEVEESGSSEGDETGQSWSELEEEARRDDMSKEDADEPVEDRKRGQKRKVLSGTQSKPKMPRRF